MCNLYQRDWASVSYSERFPNEFTQCYKIREKKNPIETNPLRIVVVRFALHENRLRNGIIKYTFDETKRYVCINNFWKNKNVNQ